MKSWSPCRLLLYLADAVFLLSLVAVPVLWLLSPVRHLFNRISGLPAWHFTMFLLPWAILVIRLLLSGWLRKRDNSLTGLWETALFKKVAMALAMTFLFLFTVEQVLEAVGFEATFPAIIFTDENQEVYGKYGFVKDRQLMWKFSPGGEFKGWRINSLGFREREVDRVKKPGVLRVICMGDSCSADGGPPYAGCLHALLTNAPPANREWEAFNAAVYGYSVVQGLRLFQLRVKDLAPDIVTLYFGWNDHWNCGYRPDALNMAWTMNRFEGRCLEVLRRKRFGQFVIRTLTSGAGSSILTLKHGKPPGGDLELYLRVPPDEYRSVLTQFIREIRAVGATPLVLTAPRGPSFTPLLVKNGQAESLEAIAERHAKYVGITREVAKATGVEVLDLAEILKGEDCYHLFNKDGVHLTQEGLQRIGEELYAKLSGMMVSAESPAAP
jgi:lysophospholipase L1-like esterase